MPRQYKILYKRLGSAKHAVLEPLVSAKLYDKPEVTAAIEHMRLNPHVEGMAIRLDDESFNIMAFSQPAVSDRAFIFAGEEGGPPIPFDTSNCQVSVTNTNA